MTKQPRYWRQSWPVKAMPFVQAIARSQERIRALLMVVLREGIEKQNRLLIDPFRRMIIDETGEISGNTQAILDCLPVKRRGRLPAWAVAADEINILAQNISNQMTDIKRFLPSNRYLNIQRLFGLASENNQAIAKQLQSIAAPLGVPEVWQEAEWQEYRKED